MSDASQTGPVSDNLFKNDSLLDDDVSLGDILVHASTSSRNFADAVDDIRAFNDLAKYRIAPASWGGRGEIQEVIVYHIDEELGGGRVWIAGAGHGDGVFVVLQTVIGLILDRLPGCLLFHSRLKTT